MSRIVFIGCGKCKNKCKCEAKDMYQGSLFKKSYAYAKQIIKADKIYVLSAKYHLVNENDEIEPYDQRIGKSKKKKTEWSAKTFKMILKEVEKGSMHLDSDELFILAGKDYCEYLIPLIAEKYKSKVCLPLDKMKQGERLQFLNSELKKI